MATLVPPPPQNDTIIDLIWGPIESLFDKVGLMDSPSMRFGVGLVASFAILEWFKPDFVYVSAGEDGKRVAKTNKLKATPDQLKAHPEFYSYLTPITFSIGVGLALALFI